MTPPLRVLQLDNLPPTDAKAGGAERYVEFVTSGLAARGHEVEVFAPGPSRFPRALLDRVHNPRARAAVAARIAAFRPDVVHVHNFLRVLSPSVFDACAHAGVPTVWTAHDWQIFCPRGWAVRSDGRPCPAPELRVCLLGGCLGNLHGLTGQAAYALTALRRPRAARVVAARVARVLAPSLEFACALTRILDRPVEQLPLPFPPTSERPSGEPSADRLLFVGRLSEEKGVDVLLRALALPAAASARLTVVGDGPDRAALERLARTLGVAERVTWRGAIRDQAVRDAALREHAALVVPSRCRETGPLVVLEAFAAGRPVLGSALGGIAELVADGHDGLTFEAGSPPALADAIARFQALDEDRRAALGRAAQARAGRWTESHHLDRLVGFYRSAASR